MTEAEEEWLTCVNPQTMLESLRGKASDRKLRLFTCGCCKLIGSWLSDEHDFYDAAFQVAVDVAEQFADGRVGEEELQRASRAAESAWTPDEGTLRERMVWSAQVAAASTTGIAFRHFGIPPQPAPIIERTVWNWMSEAMQAVVWVLEQGDGGGQANIVQANRARSQVSDLVRDVFGIPFRPLAVDSAWITPTVISLSEAIYHDRAFDRMPILADALEEAGCTNGDILEHCRSVVDHVRGCWVVDLILGKS